MSYSSDGRVHIWDKLGVLCSIGYPVEHYVWFLECIVCLI
jgi:hypothetical protein